MGKKSAEANWIITDGELYLAGQKVPAGRYSQIGAHRVVILDRDDLLPGSLDGRVACYEQVFPTKQEITSSEAIKV